MRDSKFGLYGLFAPAPNDIFIRSDKKYFSLAGDPEKSLLKSKSDTVIDGGVWACPQGVVHPAVYTAESDRTKLYLLLVSKLHELMEDYFPFLRPAAESETESREEADLFSISGRDFKNF